MSEEMSPSGESVPEGEERSEEAGQREFEIRFFQDVLKRSPGWVEVLRLLGAHYTAAGRYAEGLEMDRRLVRLCPEDAVAHYNLACSLSLVGKLDQAVESLHSAVQRGYRDLKHMQADTDLTNVREHPGYAQLVARLRQS